MLSEAEFIHFVRRALDGMAQIVEGLGDELAGTRPPLPGANSPYAILTHCLGVVEYWSGHVVHGRPDHRDMSAEFSATGPVAPLLERTRQTLDQLAADVRAAHPAQVLPGAPDRPWHHGLPEVRQGAVLQHVYEELAQHHGQMEITRDLLRALQRGDLVARAESR